MTQPENPHPYHSAAWLVVEERLLRARLHQVELERDMAERERAVLRAELDEERRVGSLAMQSTIAAERERDEARAQIEQARRAVVAVESVDDTTGTVVYRADGALAIAVGGCDGCPFEYDTIECRHPNANGVRPGENADGSAIDMWTMRPDICPLNVEPVTILRHRGEPEVDRG